jgi:3-methyladenine DNA glycosylase AlkD
MWTDDDLAGFVATKMAELGDPQVAAGQAAYLYGERFQKMRPDMAGADPFRGVKSAGVRAVEREIRSRFPITTPQEYERAVLALWRLPHREEKHLATAVAARHRKLIAFERLPLYRRLIAEGAWWDLVDDVAPRCIGHLLLNERERMGPELDRWIDDDDLWVRRSALIAHLKHGEQTDQAQLFDHCERRMHEKEFFIRKAIGWALRQHARTNPDGVRAFALAHRSEMSGLSFREATKHLGVG